MQRVLITGGAGFIGSHLAEALVAAGREVFVIDDLSTGSRANLAALDEGVALFPRRPGLAYQAARLYSAQGLTAEAIRLIETGLRTATDEKSRVRLAELQASLAAGKQEP